MTGSILGRWVQIKRVSDEPVYGIIDMMNGINIVLSQVTNLKNTETVQSLTVPTSQIASMKVLPIPVTVALATFNTPDDTQEEMDLGNPGETSNEDAEMAVEPSNENDADSDDEDDTSTFQLLRISYDKTLQDEDEEGKAEDGDEQNNNHTDYCKVEDCWCRSDEAQEDDDDSPDFEDESCDENDPDQDDFTEEEVREAEEWEAQANLTDGPSTDEMMLNWYKDAYEDLTERAVRIMQGTIDGIEHGKGQSWWIRKDSDGGYKDAKLGLPQWDPTTWVDFASEI